VRHDGVKRHSQAPVEEKQEDGRAWRYYSHQGYIGPGQTVSDHGLAAAVGCREVSSWSSPRWTGSCSLPRR
jgi:hypothetical protein